MSKPMDSVYFAQYYREEFCMCGADKPENSAQCDDCRLRLRLTIPAVQHIIENGTGDPLLQAMGEFRDLVRQAG